MKDLPITREWIDETVAKYNKQLGINKSVYVYYSLDDVPEDAKNADKSVRNYKKYAAITCISNNKKPHIMIINLEWHRSFSILDDTIAHEMLHIRFPRLEHGEDFWKMLGMVLMGKKYKNMRRRTKK